MKTFPPYQEHLTPKERGYALVAALRAIPENGKVPFQVPGDEEFTWDYGLLLVKQGEECGSRGCAIGYGEVLGLLPPETTLTTDNAHEVVREALSLMGHVVYRVFYDLPLEDATPRMVADELEAALRDRWGE